VHAIGVSDKVVVLSSEENLPEQQEVVTGQEVPSPEAGTDEVVLECLNHTPATFVKGKPRSISNPTFIKHLLLFML
jgi:hypothetical protein